MKNKLELIILIMVLLVLGIGTTIYKIKVLGFSFNPEQKATVWTVESTINFEADGGPVTVSLNLPNNSDNLVVTERQIQAPPGYTYAKVTENGVRRGQWHADKAEAGPQRIYFRVNIYRRHRQPTKPRTPPVIPAVELSGPYLSAARSLIQKARSTGKSPADICIALINMLNDPEKNDNAALLLKMERDTRSSLALLQDLLHMAKIPCRTVRGLVLSKNNKNKKLSRFIQVFDGEKWLLFNPRSAEVENPDSFLLWQKNQESLIEIEGGGDAKVRFSSLESRVLANKAAIKGGHHQHSWLIDFSIYSLPISTQNTFKLLLLIPFGALIVVILRNLVGIQTAGTFMPILIALAFLQTTLIVGLILFLTVVSVGLIMRALLSHLNLLLVPRISAILVFVITIYLAISVIGVKMGSEVGLNVTFFPMIIISWSIERMCVLWEEEGPKDVFIQGGGSLFTASLIYILMINKFIGNMAYAFPELLLVVLAIILMIGTYSGYRLSELRRFEPMGRE